MNDKIFFFLFFGIPVHVRRSAIFGSGLLVLFFTFLLSFLTEFSLTEILLISILATVLHWFSDLLHQYGHATISKWVGYPMQEWFLWWILVRPRYPKDEPELAPLIHILRALGGPIASAGVALIAAFLMKWLVPLGGLIAFLARWFFWENLLAFTVAALFPPIYFRSFNTDGGSILHWLIVAWKRRK